MLFFSSCSVDPNSDKLSDDFVVYTDYDKGNVDFSNFKNFYIPDQVLVIGDQKGEVKPGQVVPETEKEHWTVTKSKDLVDAVVDNLEDRGYTRVSSKEEADFGMQLSYVENTNTLLGFINNPGWGWNWGWNWWGGYPYYWSPNYWGLGGYGPYFYYPYPVTYSYSIGSLLLDFVDLKDTEVNPKTDKEEVPVRWTSYMSGMVYNSDNFNSKLGVNAINQAFKQSPYLINNK